jgi:pyridoxine kinase
VLSQKVNILSIQSWVACGHVGNAAAIFPLQRLGAEIMAIHTAQLSNHPGHGAFTGQVCAPADVAALVAGLGAHGALARCDAVLSGYVGDEGVGEVILDAVARVRAANPASLWCCDPVMGDDGKLYVRPGIEAFFRERAVLEADILVPNQFELGRLTGARCDILADASAAGTALRARMRPSGPRLVLVTSLETSATPPGSIDMLLLADAGCFLVRTARLPAKFSGAGDTLAALFLFHVLASDDAPGAALAAARSVAGLLWHTWQRGAGELALVAAQAEFVAPTRGAEIVRC